MVKHFEEVSLQFPHNEKKFTRKMAEQLANMKAWLARTKSDESDEYNWTEDYREGA